MNEILNELFSEEAKRVRVIIPSEGGRWLAEILWKVWNLAPGSTNQRPRIDSTKVSNRSETKPPHWLKWSIEIKWVAWPKIFFNKGWSWGRLIDRCHWLNWVFDDVTVLMLCKVRVGLLFDDVTACYSTHQKLGWRHWDKYLNNFLSIFSDV